MIIGKFLDPRAPSLPQQVGINTDDIAEILQENEEQSANIQQNTDDIELLKQQVSESGTRVRVDGELVAEWSPDELTDDLQQLRLAQSSDSLAIVGLQSDNITNKNNIARLDAETLKTPVSPPANIELVGIGTNNAQVMVNIDNALSSTSENPVQNKAIAQALYTQVEDIWNGSIIGGNSINVDLSNYKFAIITFEIYGVVNISGIIDTRITKTQYCWMNSDKSSDNGVTSIRAELTYNQTNKSLSFITNFLPQNGGTASNRSNMKMVKVAGVK